MNARNQFRDHPVGFSAFAGSLLNLLAHLLGWSPDTVALLNATVLAAFGMFIPSIVTPEYTAQLREWKAAADARADEQTRGTRKR